MVPGHDKWIRSLKDNSAGKVVADGGANRWEWQADDETARQLKKLHNDALAIERTDVRPTARTGGKAASASTKPAKPLGAVLKPSRDAGGGFNPYDHPGKPKKR
jgi:hypothetical protein